MMKTHMPSFMRNFDVIHTHRAPQNASRDKVAIAHKANTTTSKIKVLIFRHGLPHNDRVQIKQGIQLHQGAPTP